MLIKIIQKISFYFKRITRKKVISLKPKTKSKGNVLISYITSPFISQNKSLISMSHTNIWECYNIVKTFLEYGYSVDVIDWYNNNFIPKKNYKVFIDIHSNLERISPLLNKDCKKVLHITGCHWLYQNKMEYERLLELQKRRKVTLQPRRIAKPSLGIEYADYATILGNEFTISTFSYIKKPIYQIPISSVITYDFYEDKDYNKCRKNYLWLGSTGAILRGLDLLLEAFVQMPDYNLTICGPIINEIDFRDAFYSELFNSPNIKTLGWVDVGSTEFSEVIENCIALVYPSFSEGCASSVITCMHAGLIPVVSRHSGVNVADFGFIIDNPSVKEIKEKVKKLSSLGKKELEERSRRVWEYARKNHTREKFAEEYRNFVNNFLNIR